ncbi:ABC transporter ATP-binding protein [Oricola sp.]|uniref:ABC transporter ATP-binding protein n=1 Tax=Oricola sp. TaxID=1979950 RepID=UPI003BAB2BA6
MTQPILEVSGLQKHFELGGGWLSLGKKRVVDAVSGVSFSIAPGETLAVVGESGCGKSTVGRCILRLETPSGGEVLLDGGRIDNLPQSKLRELRKKIQVVFQDPFSSLNPRLKIRDVLCEPLRNFGIATGRADMDARVSELLAMVGLPADSADRWPHEFSGGQRQRIGIARALAAEPELIICDEAVSALDVSVKAQIVNLLKDLQEQTGVSLLFISHDLAIVENIAHRIAVMYLGQIVEVAPRREMLANPRHPYSRALMSAVPIPDPEKTKNRIILQGDLPSPVAPPAGCRFNTRCPHAHDPCFSKRPAMMGLGEDHLAACHLNALPDDENPLTRAVETVGR